MCQDRFAIIFGVIVSMILAGTLVIAGLKAGITPGVSPLVILFAWGAFSRRLGRGGGSAFLNIAQVAGSAGMAVTAGVIFTAPLIQILYKNQGLPVPPVDVASLIVMSLAGSLIGFGYVGLATKRFLTDPTLPAPEARACETMIEAAVTEPEKRPKLGRSLFVGLVASFLSPLIVRLGAAAEHVVLAEAEVGTRGDLGYRRFQLDLPFTPIYIGIGGLLTLSTALLVFGGSFVRLLGDSMLAQIDPADVALAARFPEKSMNWIGGGAMTVAVAYSLLRFVQRRSVTGADTGFDEDVLRIDRAQRNMLLASIVVGILVLGGWAVLRDGLTVFSISMTCAVLLCCALMVALGAILSLQIGSSASPVSGTVFVTTLVLCLVAISVGRTEIDDVLLLTPLVVGACVAVCAANDSSQDYKTMQLCHLRVQRGFLAQILGLLVGCLVVPVVLYVAHAAYGLGSENLRAPQATMFATLVQGLLFETNLPWWPIGIGVAIGTITVAADVLGARRGLQLPAMAFAVGIYLPPFIGVGILIGTLCRWWGERRSGRQRNESILAAAGLITGAAAFDLLLGGLILGGFDERSLNVIDKLHLPTGLVAIAVNAVAICGIALLGSVLYFNSKPQQTDRP